jgi:TrmH family RNA methyltransferase
MFRLFAITGGVKLEHMRRFIPIIVEPKYEGNVGSIARLCRNFGLSELILVNPPEIGDEALSYSMHGKEILLEADIVGTFDEAREKVDFVVGTSGISESAEKNYHRNPVSPGEFVRWTERTTGRIGLAFGREDFGLLNDELDSCDMLITIPANLDYPVLNLSHAVCVILYELFRNRVDRENRNARTINRIEKETLLDHYDRLMEVSSVPEHKKPIARTNFRRMISRSSMNYREFNSFMGTLSRAMDYKRKKFNDWRQR